MATQLMDAQIEFMLRDLARPLGVRVHSDDGMVVFRHPNQRFFVGRVSVDDRTAHRYAEFALPEGTMVSAQNTVNVWADVLRSAAATLRGDLTAEWLLDGRVPLPKLPHSRSGGEVDTRPQLIDALLEQLDVLAVTPDLAERAGTALLARAR